MRKLNNPALSLLVLTGLIASFSGCSRRASDEAMAKDIQGKISSDPDTKDSPVSVAAKDGKVTLSGSVTSPAAQQKIDQIAREEPGARGVDDQTSIQPDATQAAQPVNPAPVEQPRPQPIVIPAGTVLVVTTSQALSSKTNQAGQTFLGTLAQPVSAGGRTALPKGATVSGTVVTAKTKGKIKGEGELALALTSVSTKEHTYQIQTNVLSSTIKGKGKRTAATTGGGAAGGALIGGLAGGGKGAGIGALAGAGAGTAVAASKKGQQLQIPSETLLEFRLEQPVALPVAR